VEFDRKSPPFAQFAKGGAPEVTLKSTVKIPQGHLVVLVDGDWVGVLVEA
jgi:hypothetical protein